MKLKLTMLALSLSIVSININAALRDHGPVSQTDFFPDWYRETAESGGMAIGQCIYADDAGNGPLCLTGPSDALPDRFPGNIGDEAFFATADVELTGNGFNMLWLGHLEMAYLTADGSPPAVHDASDPQEVVFSRERIRIDLPSDDNCSGSYIVRTPYAVHQFEMEAGNRALFYTDDQTAIPGNFTAALKGHAGPFLKWNVGQDGVNPVSADNPAVVFTPTVGSPRKYIGDPNTPHLFTGSTVPAGPGHEEKGFNNYVEITPPATCDLGAGPGTPLFEELASISGRIWDLPIQDPVIATSATYVRDDATAALDVWADGSKNQNVVLTASSDNSQQMPSVTMVEEIIDGSRTGRYHTHLEFDKDQPIPASITVTNLSSNPVSNSSRGVVDAVVITKSTFNPVTNVLCIAAHSGDQTSPLPLHLEAPNYGAFGTPTASCPAVDSQDVVLEKDLDDFAGDHRIPPEGVFVQSDRGGAETSHPINLTGVSDAGILAGAVADTFFHVPGTSTTALDLTGPAFGLEPDFRKETVSADTTPGNHRIVIITQPSNGLGEVVGSVTAPAAGGTVTFAAKEGMVSQTLTFYYAIQDTSSPGNPVTNVARVDMQVDQVLPPPVGVADRQGVFRTSAGSVLSVLANDTTGLTNTAINPASIQIVTAPARGTAVPNGSGGIIYTPVGQALTTNNTIDTFTYTVANVGGARSQPITVQVALKSAAEAIAFQRVRFNNGWDIRFTSSYAGTAGSIVLAPTASCAVIANPGAPTRVGAIGGVVNPAAGANNYVVSGATPAPSGNNWTVRCTTSSGGGQNRTGTL
jgi:Bacterial Ig domain